MPFTDDIDADNPDPEDVHEQYLLDCAASGIEPHQVPHDALVVAANVLARARRRARARPDAPRPPAKAPEVGHS
jgi:hypothetical protein